MADEELTGSGTMHQGDDRATVVVADHAESPERELVRGTVLNHRFVIESVLGRGGMGVVYRALDRRKAESGDRLPHVALKVLSTRFRRDKRMAIALQREARKAQDLAHPNITTVYDFDRDGELVYLTMEEMSGQPLDQLIASSPGGLPLPRVRQIINGAARGLAHAHARGVVHADFKPSNVFLTREGEARVLDFGIARAAPASWLGGEAPADSEPGEATRFVAGELSALTPSYAALEMFAGEETFPADDVYALAIVTYKLITGHHPYAGHPAPEARRQGLKPQRPRGLRAHEWRALRRGLSFERRQRQRDAGEFLRAWRGRGRLLTWAAIGGVLAALAIAFIIWERVDQRLHHAPDVAFDRLPLEARREVEHLMNAAVIARYEGERRKALALYQQAYALHPRNRWVVDEMEEVVEEMVDAGVAGEPAATEALRQRLQSVLATDTYLQSHPGLTAQLERLQP